MSLSCQSFFHLQVHCAGEGVGEIHAVLSGCVLISARRTGGLDLLHPVGIRFTLGIGLGQVGVGVGPGIAALYPGGLERLAVRTVDNLLSAGSGLAVQGQGDAIGTGA